MKTERDFIADTTNWPHWPFLPLKKPGALNMKGNSGFAVLLQVPLGKFQICRDVLLWAMPKDCHWEPITLDALIAEGWIGD
jgi:hypothetical protein